MSFGTRKKSGLVWIDQKGHYSNNKYWDHKFFYVSGEWESFTGEVLPEEKKVPWQWGTLKKEWDELSQLIWDQKMWVKAALKFTETKKDTGRHFDAIVTDAALRGMFGYQIPEWKVLMKRRQSKSKTLATGSSELVTMKKDEASRSSPPSAPGAILKKKSPKKKVHEDKRILSLEKLFPKSSASPAANLTPFGSHESTPPPPPKHPITPGESWVVVSTEPDLCVPNSQDDMPPEAC